MNASDIGVDGNNGKMSGGTRDNQLTLGTTPGRSSESVITEIATVPSAPAFYQDRGRIEFAAFQRDEHSGIDQDQREPSTGG